jgi:signal transduction histidine kinase
MQTAHRLGRQAFALGLEAGELALIHRTAVMTLLGPGDSSPAKARIRKLAGAFLVEVIAAFEKAHCTGQKSAAVSSREDRRLARHTTQLVAANRRLQEGVGRHRTAEDSLRKSRDDYAMLLRESDRLQKHLRYLTHQLLSEQEAERKRISHELQDEVAQTLLGINVRLLTLKKTARSDSTMLRKEIASAQSVVEKSVQTITRFAREFEVRKHA